MTSAPKTWQKALAAKVKKALNLLEMKEVAKSINDRTVIVIAGPTAVGKTAIALQLAQHFNTAIISADSRQCYKEMNIGTAKPTKEELQAIKHYFIDEFSVTEHITAADYERLALNYLEDVFSKNNIAIVCGGTGLYIKALCEGLDEMPTVDAAIENRINQEYKEKGIAWLQQEIKEKDFQFFQQGENENPARLLRALIFTLSTGQSILEYRTGDKKRRDFNILKLVLNLPREVLYKRINHRVETMMQEGLLEEVKSLYAYKDLKNLQTVGYSELFEYLAGNYSLDEAVEKIKQHTRNYAKRQITWFKKEKDAIWLDAANKDLVSTIISEVL